MDPNQQIARVSVFFSHTPPKINMLNPRTWQGQRLDYGGGVKRLGVI